MGVEEMGARENQKRSKQHPTRCLPLPYCKRNKPNNNDSGSSNHSCASAVTHTDTTEMVDNVTLYDTCHRNVDVINVNNYHCGKKIAKLIIFELMLAIS